MVAKGILVLFLLACIATKQIFIEASCGKNSQMDYEMNELDDYLRNQYENNQFRDLITKLSENKLLVNERAELEKEGKRFQPQIRLGKRFSKE